METDLGFPLHADRADYHHDDDGYDSNNADVVVGSVDDFEALGAQQVVEGVAEPYSVHRRCDCIGKGENDANTGTELGTQGSRNNVVYATCGIR